MDTTVMIWKNKNCGDYILFATKYIKYIFTRYIYVYTHMQTYLIHIYHIQDINININPNVMPHIYPSMSTAKQSRASSQKVSKVMLSCSEAWLKFLGNRGDMWIYAYIYIYYI